MKNTDLKSFLSEKLLSFEYKKNLKFQLNLFFTLFWMLIQRIAGIGSKSFTSKYSLLRKKISFFKRIIHLVRTQNSLKNITYPLIRRRKMLAFWKIFRMYLLDGPERTLQVQTCTNCTKVSVKCEKFSCPEKIIGCINTFLKKKSC